MSARSKAHKAASVEIGTYFESVKIEMTQYERIELVMPDGTTWTVHPHSSGLLVRLTQSFSEEPGLSITPEASNSVILQPGL